MTNDNGRYSVGATIGRFNPGAELTLVWGLSPDAMVFTNTTTSASAGQMTFVEATNVVADTSYFYQLFITEGGEIVDVAANEVPNFFTGERDVWVTRSGAMDEAGPDSAMLTFHRTGNLGEAVTVNYEVGGTAVAGLDYLADGITGTIVYYAEIYPSPAHGGGVTDIPNIAGVATGISVSYVSGAFAATKRLLAPNEYAQYSVTRTVSSEVASRFPLSVYMNGASGSDTEPLTFRFTGLKPDWRYTFEFFAGFENWGTPSGETQFTLVGATTTTGTLAAATNYENLLTLPRILPAADGTVVMSYAATSGSDDVLNAMRIIPVEPISTLLMLR